MRKFFTGLIFTRARIFLLCNLGFIAGIALASFLAANSAKQAIFWFGGLAASAAVSVFFWDRKTYRTGGFVLLFLFLGLWRYAVFLPADSPGNAAYYNGRSVTLVGVVQNEPDIRDKNTKLEVKSKKLEVRSGKEAAEENNPRLSGKPVEGKILVTTELYPRYQYGDELRLECELKAPERFNGFAYDRYLARYDIYSVCYYPPITKISAGQGNYFYASIFRLKNRLYQVMDKGLNEPAASFARALILGDKKGMSEELKEKFARSGLSHLAAISGDCISIIAAMAMSLLLGLGVPRRYAFYFASVFLLIYVILIGLPASALRAGLMGFLVLLALHLGRLNKSTNALVFAAAAMLIINPRLLRDDIGFQLSFLAVAGLAYVYPLLEQKLGQSKIFSRQPLNAVKSAFNLTLAAQVFTWPIVADNFSRISLVSPLANILVLWALPFTLAFGFGAMILGLFIIQWSAVFFLPVWVLLNYIIRVAGFTAGLPYSALKIDYMWPGWFLLYYLLSAYLVWRWRRKAKEKNI